MNYENKDTQIISIRQVNLLGLDQSWFAHLRGQTEFRSIKNKFEQLNETVNDNHVDSINNLTKKAFCSSQISVLERRKINDMNFVFFLFITL